MIMASAVLTLQSFVFGFSANSPPLPIPSIPIYPYRVLQISSVQHTHNLKLKHLSRASLEGVPTELVENSKFVPLNADDPQYGPPALLLLGFDLKETTEIQELLKNMDGEFLKIAKSLPRICFLSGLTGEEMMMFIDAFPESGLEPAVFAALVPNSANKLLQDLIDEIMGDNEMVTAKVSGST